MLRLLLRRERAQVLPITALLLVVMLALVGMAVDAGRVYVARAELVRALDSAALAGVVELPDLADAESKASIYMEENQPDATVEFPAQTPNQFRVRGRRTVNYLFMNVLGFSSTEVQGTAAAGFGIVPVDGYLTLDATGSMHTGCNSSETNGGGACPIKEARDAATGFVNTLMSGPADGLTLLGAGAFRGCYNLPRNNVKCIKATPPGSMITDLTTSQATLTAGISAIRAIGATGQPSGGSGTNICLALKKAQDVIFGPAHHTEPSTVRFVVILSDGDNVYNATEVNQNSPQSPDAPCRPTSPATAQGDVGPNCRPDTQPQEGKVDVLSKSMADTLKGQGVEIYVVAFGVCGTLNGTTPSAAYCGGIGSGETDSIADQRLLKCIASSTPGSNDHYYAVPTAADLPAVFQQVANAIAFRLIE